MLAKIIAMLFLLLLFCGGNAHAQGFEAESSSEGKEQTTTSSSAKMRNIINKSDAEWTFATPASKGLSQSSLEVRS
jgi:hypothetical protein